MGWFSRSDSTSNRDLKAASQLAKADRLRRDGDRQFGRGNAEKAIELHARAANLERRAGR